MNIGFGSLRQMSDTLKYNRDILPKRKSPREIYREETKKSLTTGDGADLELVRARVRQRLQKARQNDVVRKVAVIAVPLLLISIVVCIVVTADFTTDIRPFHEEKVRFISQTYPMGPEVVCKVDYFPSGPKAAETYLVKNLKHHTAYSYYESGEIFRSAEFYYDTLLRENYFFKNGDTIQRFPDIRMDVPQHVEITMPHGVARISFDFFDGKIIGGTYNEIMLARK